MGRSNGNDYLRWIREKGLDPASVLGPPSDIGWYERTAFAGFTSSLHRGGLKLPTPDSDNVTPAHHQTTWCTEKAIEFISEPRSSDQPWLLSVNPFDPHPPFDPPWEYFRRFDPETLPGPHFRETDLDQQERLKSIDFQSHPRRPEEFDARSVRAAYYAMIELIDDQLGAILKPWTKPASVTIRSLCLQPTMAKPWETTAFCSRAAAFTRVSRGCR